MGSFLLLDNKALRSCYLQYKRLLSQVNIKHLSAKRSALN